MSAEHDLAARRRALTDTGSNLLVEAAAGTGKTALMAGRIALLLAGGTEPRSIVAITFTTLAASQLAARVREYVDRLLAGETPPPLRSALPDGLDESRRQVLEGALSRFGELTVTTIHGFCLEVIRSYSVEAGADPGARVLDAAGQMALFERAFEAWFKARLSDEAMASEVVNTLARQDPHAMAALLRDLSRFRLDRPTARPIEGVCEPEVLTEFVESVREFRRWLDSAPPEPGTALALGDLEVLAAHLQASPAMAGFAELWRKAHPPRLDIMRRDSSDLLAYRRRSAWKAAIANGRLLADVAEEHYERAAGAWRRLAGQIATVLLASISSEVDGVLAQYEGLKRAAATLDFNDLLLTALKLVRERPEVRRALSGRYGQLLIDEFQDTDPVQAEFLFRVAAEGSCETWREARLRPGSLFLVGDPKQSIFRFRGADLPTYDAARAVVESDPAGAVLQITANFRSRGEIIDHVNQCFRPALSRTGQPGYVELAGTLGGARHGLPCVAKLTVETGRDPRVGELRDAEAEAVADLCVGLIRGVQLETEDGTRRPVRPGDIALLVPVSSELWRYERALDARALPLAFHAGGGLFRRQEAQDLVALTRALADPSDTLAFGALMRGPLVGLTDGELLGISEQVRGSDDRGAFTVRSDPNRVQHPVARDVLQALQDLRRRSTSTTPRLLIGEAVERLRVRATVSNRFRRRSARAEANIDAFLKRASAFDVRGLKAFARAVHADWSAGAQASEGRVDGDGQAIEIVTMHSAKGLEWPIVIPINTGGAPRRRDRFVHRTEDDTLHWLLGDIEPPTLRSALEEEDRASERERERLLYVACTRARELLIVPHLAGAGTTSWSRVIDLRTSDLPEIRLPSPAAAPLHAAPFENEQTADVFRAEAEQVGLAAPALRWRKPSEHDRDRGASEAAAVMESSGEIERPLAISGGRIRGVMLHKLMEEVLSGLLAEDPGELEERAIALSGQLPPAAEGVDAAELAATVLRTLGLPVVAENRTRLVPEVALSGFLEQGVAASARADALVVVDGRIELVIDWKSDVAPSPGEQRLHFEQLSDYLKLAGAGAGAVVYMTTGEVARVTAMP